MRDKTRQEWRIIKNTMKDGSDLFVVEKGSPLESDPDTIHWSYQMDFRFIDKAMEYLNSHKVVAQEIVLDSSDKTEQEE